MTKVDDEVARLEALGAKVIEVPHDVGDGIRVAAVLDPFGNTKEFCVVQAGAWSELSSR